MSISKLIKAILPLVLAAALITLASCAKPAPEVPGPDNALELVPPAEWPVLSDDLDAESLALACDSSMEYLRRLPPDRLCNFGGVRLSAARLLEALAAQRDILVRYPDPLERTRALQNRFDLYRSRGSDGRGRVLFTGYYEPMLEARRQADDRFDMPIYGMPENLVTINPRDFRDDLPDRKLIGMVDQGRVVPFYEREQIDFEGKLLGKAPVLGYVDDMIDSFFLQIQGSGQLMFEDGERMRVGYAGVNGHPYRSIGRMLLDEGLMEPGQMSMQGIDSFLERNPQYLRRVLSHNPSYVFFRVLDAQGGPLGCYGVPIEAGRSIATDRRFFAAPAMAYIQTPTPTAEGLVRPVARFVLNMDTGGAIRGAGRVDLFFGTGDEAGKVAGGMKYDGSLYFLLPKLEEAP